MINLSLYDTIWLVGGAIAAGLLWGIFVSAIKRRGTPLPLLLLIFAGALWYTGDAVRILIEQAAPGALAAAYAAQVARCGTCFLPSALLATVLISADQQRNRIVDGLRRNLVPVAVVPGLFVFAIGLWDVPLKRVAFSVYAIAALLCAAWLCRSFARQLTTEVQRSFYRLTAVALTGIAILACIAYPLGGINLPLAGPALDLALFLSPIAPAYILGYYIYRYSFFRIVVNPALLYSALTGIVLTVYLLVIRRVAEELGRLGGGFRVEVVEAVLISLLIFLFQPIKNRLQGAINRLFFKARYEYQHLLGTLSQTLNVPDALESRLKAVVDAVGTVLKVHLVSLVLFENEDGRVDNVKVISGVGLAGFDPPTAPFSRSEGNQEQVRQVADWMLSHRRALDVGELHRPALAAVLAEQGARLCIPVLQEEKLTGFLCLGEKKRSVPYSSEEWELLGTLCNQVALAVENTRLVERRLQLERRMYEAERLSALGLLSASIAHEVKNPLSSMKAIATVLREDLENDPDKAGDLTVVLNEIDRLGRVVDRLLKFAQPKQCDTFEPVDIKSVLDDVVLILSHEAERRGVEIRADVAGGLVVSGDPEDLKEVFFNLILNGIQAMDDSDRTTDRRLTVRAVRSDGSVSVRVSDNGPGISGEVLSHVFEPFFTTKASGTGLGLATVKRDVERMGGLITVVNGEQAGAVFEVHLPGVDDAA
ncbi:MAG: ATP-binding protein [Gemmatimonadetes bacterium]|nr:ATP-binding protein [Gemmatimonadota bacterium]MDE3260094.1 ATP-binding protein [Gemmatimonadota bacterium]